MPQRRWLTRALVVLFLTLLGYNNVAVFDAVTTRLERDLPTWLEEHGTRLTRFSGL